jgi:hypothetical protein
MIFLRLVDYHHLFLILTLFDFRVCIKVLTCTCGFGACTKVVAEHVQKRLRQPH